MVVQIHPTDCGARSLFESTNGSELHLLSFGLAALPPHSAVRLRLTVKSLKITGGYASGLRRSLNEEKRSAPERPSLSALCGGKAARGGAAQPTPSVLQNTDESLGYDHSSASLCRLT